MQSESSHDSEALKAVESTLNLNASVHENSQGKNPGRISKKLARFAARFHLSETGKARLKAFATSNVGITLMVLLVVVITFGISMIRHHHQSQTTVAINSAWQMSAPNQMNTANQPAVNNLPVTPSALDVDTKTKATDSTMKTVLQSIKKLNHQMTLLNQRVMVISELLSSKQNNHTPPASTHYRVLGWRLDQNTNAWVADIEYQGQVKAYRAGQHIGKWVVEDVNANGVKIL